MKAQNSILSVLTVIIFGISCKYEKKIPPEHNQNYFGNENIAKMSYFKEITGKSGYDILKKQNDRYSAFYVNFKNTNDSKAGIFRFKKQSLDDKKNYRIVLYTFVNNIKKDSLEFYRNSIDSDYEPSDFTCVSYLDLKTNKVWQLKYFSSATDRSVNFVSYQKSSIINGVIKSDSLYYLDESLDVEMDKRNLYY
jgi:hypothetical protein